MMSNVIAITTMAKKGTRRRTLMNNRSREVVIILKSCLTGKPIWFYLGPTKRAAQKAYERACRAEVEHVKNWSDYISERRAAIRRFINNITSNLPLTGDLKPEQKEALKKLNAMEKQESPCYTEFFNHIMEVRRRRDEDRKIRRRVRERETKEKQEQLNKNNSYDK